MAGITTHVLDTSVGRPAEGVPVVLEQLDGEEWTEVGSGLTDGDGRLADLLASDRLEAATYRLRFDTAAYFGSRGFMASSMAMCAPLDAPISPTWSARPLNSAARLLSQRTA